mgnify:CR=1 FL=1
MALAGNEGGAYVEGVKRLTLFRHAKASQDGSAPRDFDRTLTDEGRRQAARMGAYMAAQGLRPDLALVSPSQRTMETFDLAAPHLNPAPRLVRAEPLYNALPATIVDEITGAPETAAHILVIGHNPGLHALALMLIDPRAADPALIEQLQQKFPPGALAHFALAIDDWPALDGARGALERFETPKSLGQ